MANLMPEQTVEVRVGDKGRRVSFIITKTNRKEARALTDYDIWVSFWIPGAEAIHVRRNVTSVDTVNGVAYYTLVGDEFPSVGVVCAQVTMSTSDWYLGNASGRASHMASGEIVKFIVKARPA